MKMKLKYLTVPLISLSANAIANIDDVSVRGPNGYAHQIPCVKITEPFYKDLKVRVKQYIDDSGIDETTDEFFYINSGTTGSFCGTQIDGKIWVNGWVGVSWDLTDTAGKSYANFSTRSHFNGEGGNNDWDIEENGQCAAVEGNGVYLEYGSTKSCSKLKNVPDSAVVKAMFVPNLKDDLPDYGYPHYNADAVVEGSQVFKAGDIVYGESTRSLYKCKITNWCNGLPTYYAPGDGLNWNQAWDPYELKFID
ncbi:hypothetical protein [Vibrio sagamiensis]|uniref:Carbohydrate-binding domain-containing protein n=1 Tax=Vibrio sagamiensis NBRC 104589 TaxID=1219064 RepID=A0A511QHG8_9VIBR|nr:hypothetical protein [Vibrio sagamiensis]PNQ53638.1 hypothetical protein C1141_20215 [Vibrio agarivorans]GEM76759.1 hypothetical protein VSA01S_28710 [Vibrio sagamiensis NBRC 104589]